jgi:NADH-quinone oxidoreductase subunit F
MGIKGENLPGVYDGVEYLRDCALGKAPEFKGKKVADIGGGNVAIDASRTAWREGASQVHVIYRRTQRDMPAYREEIEAAEQEGVIFHYLAAPIRVLGDECVEGLEIQNQQLSEFDTSGRRRPIPIEASAFTLKIDALIQAIGQQPDLQCVAEGALETNRNATIRVGRNLATSRQGVFAVGDAVSGPASVIEAVAQGNRAAAAVDHYLRTGTEAQIDAALEVHLPELTWNMEDYSHAARIRPEQLDAAERSGSFREVDLPVPEEKICDEAKRCLRCDLEWQAGRAGAAAAEKSVKAA